MKKTILVVDDEQDLRELISDLLIDEGFECLIAGSAQEATQIVMEHHKKKASLDLIVSDLNMPGGSGIDLLLELREKEVLIPFLYLSGDVIDSELKPYLGMGVIGYQLKPFRSTEFIARLKKIFA